MRTNELQKTLIEKAAAARKKAYVPYSHYAVGAALLTDDGEIISGANVENAVYPLTLCAERVAVFSAVSQGKTKFQAIAVVTRNGGTPCGACRQVLAEFGLDTIVLIADTAGTLLNSYTVAELLPESFGKADLKDS